jgi:hypothetical protein
MGYGEEESCANAMRDSDTGEHISNEKNELQYIPFPICNETGKPLELQYGIEDGMFLSIPSQPLSLPLTSHLTSN